MYIVRLLQRKQNKINKIHQHKVWKYNTIQCRSNQMCTANKSTGGRLWKSHFTEQ